MGIIYYKIFDFTGDLAPFFKKTLKNGKHPLKLKDARSFQCDKTMTFR